MGFGSWLKETCTAIKRGAEEFISDAVDLAKDVYQKGKELATAVGTAVTEAVKGWVRPNRKHDWSAGQSKGDGVPAPPQGGKTERELIAELEARIDLIDSYQEQVRGEAEVYEDIVKDAYIKKYDQIVRALGDVMDTRHIENFIKSKSQSFANLMRDEINSAITYGNRQLRRLMNDTSLSRYEYSDRIQDYVDTIYDRAKDNLLAELQKAFLDTDSYIKVNAKKFLQDEQEILKGLKINLTNLSKEGDAKERELEKIGKEYATLTFVRSLANNKVD